MWYSNRYHYNEIKSVCRIGKPNLLNVDKLNFCCLNNFLLQRYKYYYNDKKCVTNGKNYFVKPKLPYKFNGNP